jgi:hypothetical protein
VPAEPSCSIRYYKRAACFTVARKGFRRTGCLLGLGAHQDFERAYLKPSNELHGHAAAALCGLVDARQGLVGSVVAARRVLAVPSG